MAGDGIPRNLCVVIEGDGAGNRQHAIGDRFTL